MLTSVTRRIVPDAVQLPRLTLAWLTPPRFAPGDAELDVVAQVLGGGKNSRLYKRLVYDMQIAQDVTVYQDSASLGSSFQIEVMVRPSQDGAAPQALVDRVLAVVDEELDTLGAAPPEPRELQRAVNQIEAAFYQSLERVGGFGGRADRLNAYYTYTGNPDWFDEDLARYRALSPRDVQAAARRYLPRDRRVELIVLPETKEARQ
jgi:zinc protease